MVNRTVTVLLVLGALAGVIAVSLLLVNNIEIRQTQKSIDVVGAAVLSNKDDIGSVHFGSAVSVARLDSRIDTLLIKTDTLEVRVSRVEMGVRILNEKLQDRRNR